MNTNQPVRPIEQPEPNQLEAIKLKLELLRAQIKLILAQIEARR